MLQGFYINDTSPMQREYAKVAVTIVQKKTLEQPITRFTLAILVGHSPHPAMDALTPTYSLFTSVGRQAGLSTLEKVTGLCTNRT